MTEISWKSKPFHIRQSQINTLVDKMFLDKEGVEWWTGRVREQEKFLADNIAEWEHLKKRIKVSQTVTQVKFEPNKKVKKGRKSLLQKILEML